MIRRLVAWKLAALALPLMLVVTLTGLIVGGAATGGEEPDASSCTSTVATAGDATADPGLLPYAPTGEQTRISVDPEQRVNVATILSVVRSRGLVDRAAVIAVATALQESVLRNIDYGDRDSLGLFQQRPSQGWGSREQILDPVYSTGKFLDGLVGVDGYLTRPLTDVAQQVQRSGFPLAYAKWETQAAELVTASDGTTLDPALLAGGGPSPCGLVPGGSASSGPVIPGGLAIRRDWPAETASIDDPTTGGLITARTLAGLDALTAGGWAVGGVSCWDAHLWNPTSDHPLGKGCDVFFGHPAPDQVALGWGLANYLVANQATLGVKYLIWQGQFWQAADPGRWVPYASTIYGCPNPAEITGCHYDHVHISYY